MKTKTHRLRVLFACLALLGMLKGADSIHAQDGIWTNAAPLPQATAGPALATANGLLYAVGGGNGPCSSSSSVFAYDLGLNSWTQKASLLNEPVSGVTVANLNGTLYALGGGNGCTSVGVANFDAYDPVHDTWTSKNPFPFNVRGACALVAGGTLYVVGGLLDNNPPNIWTNGVFAYSPGTDSWSLASTLPAPLAYFTCAVANEVIYVMCGNLADQGSSQAEVPTTAVWAYNPTAGVWTTNAPMPVQMEEAQAATLNGMIYVTGGYAGGTSALVETYNPQTDTWGFSAPLPATLGGAGCAALNGNLYVVGGQTAGGSFLSSTFVFTPAVPGELTGIVVTPVAAKANAGSNIQFTATSWFSGGTAVALTNASQVTWTSDTPAVASIDTNGLASGISAGVATITATSGSISGSAVLTVVAPPATGGSYAGRWSEEPPLPVAAAGAIVGSAGGILYVAGGGNGVGLSGLYSYNPTSSTWTTLAPMPGARYQTGFGVISNKLYMAGGWSTVPPLPNNNLWVYDPSANSWASKASMPLLSCDGACGVISNKFYVTTPEDGFSGPYQNSLHVYDPASDSWASLPGSPSAHATPGYGVISNKLYVVGGYGNSGYSAQLDVYDPASNGWTTKSPMPTARHGCASAVLDGKLYVVGGDAGGPILNVLEVYDPVSDSWTSGPAMINPRSYVSGAEVGGSFFAIGGYTESALGQEIVLATNEVFTPSLVPVPDSLTAGANSITRLDNTTVAKVLLSTLLTNDSDSNPTLYPLSITAVGNPTPAGATVAIMGNFVVYSAPSTNGGNGSFTYTLTDGPGGNFVTGSVSVIQTSATAGGLLGPNAASIVASGPNFTLAFLGVPGHVYRVQYSTSISSPAWRDFSPAAIFTAPANGVITYTDANPPPGQRYYRLIPD